jgi:hypothetical protein
MTKGCEKSALNIMFPGMSPKICIKAGISDIVYLGSPLFLVDPEPFLAAALAVIKNCKSDMTKGCEKPALDIMFPGMSPKICIKAGVSDIVCLGSPLLLVDPEPFLLHQLETSIYRKLHK